MSSDLLTDELLFSLSSILTTDNEVNNKLSRANECLEEALVIFQKNGFDKQAKQISNLLNKLSTKEEKIEFPAIHMLMKAGISQRDLKAFDNNNSYAIAKVNLALHSMGYSFNNIVSFLGSKAMTENDALNVVGSSNISSLEKLAKGDWHTKGLTPKKEVENLKDHGTPFNMLNDQFSANDTDANWSLDEDINGAEDFDKGFADLLGSIDLNASDEDLMGGLEDFEDEK